jgi:hypothetical protein
VFDILKMSLSDTALMQAFDSNFQPVSFKDDQTYYLIDQNNNSGSEVRFEGSSLQNKWVNYSALRIAGDILISNATGAAMAITDPVCWKTSQTSLFNSAIFENHGVTVQRTGDLLQMRTHVEQYLTKTEQDSKAQDGDIGFYPVSFPNYSPTGAQGYALDYSQMTGAQFGTATTATYEKGLSDRMADFRMAWNGSNYTIHVDMPISVVLSCLRTPLFIKPRKGLNPRFRFIVNSDAASILKGLQSTTLNNLTYSTRSNWRLYYKEEEMPLEIEKMEEEKLEKGTVEYGSFTEHQVTAIYNRTTDYSNETLVSSILNPAKVSLVEFLSPNSKQNLGDLDSCARYSSFNLFFNGRPVYLQALDVHSQWEQLKRVMGSVSEQILKGRCVLNKRDWLYNNRILSFDLSAIQQKTGNLSNPMSLQVSATREGSADTMSRDSFFVIENTIYMKLHSSKNVTSVIIQTSPFVAE